MDVPKTTFMLSHVNFYYIVMPFRIKNGGTTYQCLMYVVFAHQVGRNLEVYANDLENVM